MPANRFLGVGRARGDKPAGGGEEWGEKPPIKRDRLQAEASEIYMGVPILPHSEGGGHEGARPV